jgi:predicted house-cleaning noncanonical NTP pyrophosphatase (MazG superfamily)
MGYKKFLQNKLWRDKAAQMLAIHGSYVDAKTLNDEEFAEELKLKIQEEVAEIVASKSKQELIEECADVLEVILAFGSLHGFSLRDVLDAQVKKREERGGFEARMFVTHAYHRVGSFGENYCLKSPEKYPEIKDTSCD